MQSSGVWSAIILLVICSATSWARTWKDQSGKFTIQAELISFKDGKVYLEKGDGDVVGVPIAKLSVADQNYLRGLKSNFQLQNYFRSNPLPTPNAVLHLPNVGTRCHSLDFSPDGRLLAVATDRGTMIVDLNKSALVKQPSSQSTLNRIEICRFSPDGEKLVVASSSRQASVIPVGVNGTLGSSVPLTADRYRIHSMAFSRDGKYLLIGDDRKLLYWDLSTGKLIHTLVTLNGDFRGKIWSCFVNPKGTQCVGCDGASLVLFDLATGKPIQKMNIAKSPSSYTYPCFISPDGTRVLSLVSRRHLLMWKTLEGTAAPQVVGRQTIESARFSPDGTKLLLAGHARVEVWDVTTMKPITGFQTAASYTTRAIAFASDSRHVAAVSGSSSACVQVFRIP